MSTKYEIFKPISHRLDEWDGIIVRVNGVNYYINSAAAKPNRSVEIGTNDIDIAGLLALSYELVSSFNSGERNGVQERAVQRVGQPKAAAVESTGSRSVC